MASHHSNRNTHRPIKPFPSHIDRDRFGAYLSGFIDGEGCLFAGTGSAGGRRNSCYRRVSLRIALRADDVDILKQIHSYFGCGLVSPKRQCKSNGRPGEENMQYCYIVSRASDLAEKVLPHFDRHPLRSKKSVELAIWRGAVLLAAKVVSRNRTNIGFRKFNKVWSDEESAKFLDSLLEIRSHRQFLARSTLSADDVRTLNDLPDPFPDNINRQEFGDHLSGLIDGEGCFSALAYLGRQSRHRNYSPQFMRKVSMSITLRSDDLNILKLVRAYWGCGRFVLDNPSAREPKTNQKVRYSVDRSEDLLSVVVPHFDRHPLRAKKLEDYRIWREAVLLAGGLPRQRRRWLPTESDQFKVMAASLKEQRRFRPKR